MNARGALTIDFLFAFFLVSGFSMVVMTYSATLSTVEVAQYIAFASARNYFAANEDEASQQRSAYAKFKSLKSNLVIAPLLSGGWFHVSDESFIATSDVTKHSALSGYSPDPTINLFQGVVFEFEARILDFQIPFFGATRNLEEAGDGKKENSSGFTTKVTAFLGREPTYNECNEFNHERFKHILQLRDTSGSGYSSPYIDPSSYAGTADDGC